MRDVEMRAIIAKTLEDIVDPCSLAIGAPAGLVSMGLVGPIVIKCEEGGNQADIEVTLFVTEPGCMMSAFFQIAAKEKLEKLEGVSSATVHLDHGHIWDPSQMTERYSRRLKEHRSRQNGFMQKLNA